MLKSCPQYTELYTDWKNNVAHATSIYEQYIQTGNGSFLETFATLQTPIKNTRGAFLDLIQSTVSFSYNINGVLAHETLNIIEAELMNFFVKKNIHIIFNTDKSHHIASICPSQKYTETPEVLQMLQMYLPYFSHLTSFDCGSSSKITTLPILPDTVTNLDCTHARSLTGISYVPPFLKELYCGGYSQEIKNPCRSLPNSLPQTLEVLDCQYASITSLPPLPIHLKNLDVRWCEELTTLPPLPPHLESLDVGGCINLTEETKLMIKKYKLTHPHCIIIAG